MGRVYIRGIFRTGNALALDLLVMRESEYANRALEGIYIHLHAATLRVRKVLFANGVGSP